MASQLSVILNAEDKIHSYVVLNAGVTALDSTLERERLAYELNHGLKPGIVVVLDGGLDLVGGFYLGLPGRPVVTGRTYLGELFYKYFPDEHLSASKHLGERARRAVEAEKST
jgi:hypothetical protein